MICTIDVETYKKNKEGIYEPVLDATGEHFVLGVVYKDSGGHKTFYKKEDMWNYIIELGKKEFKRGKRLVCYGHNMKYDSYNIMDLEDKNLRWFSENPFICGYYDQIIKEFNNEDEFQSWRSYANRNRINFSKEIIDNKIVVKYNKEIIKFLDTLSLFKMSLKKMGKIIGIPKQELPIEIGRKLTKKKLKVIAKYCLNDCKVTMGGIQFLKDKLRNDKVNIRNLCTINQIAISYIINKLREGNNEHILFKSKEGKLSEYTWKTKFSEEIHSAYRGGYVRVWKTGRIKNTSIIDFNSLYPYSAMQIRFPDLRTERKIEKPLDNYSIEGILNEIGISRVMIKNNTNKLGLLPIRGIEKSYVPLEGKILIGTWTNMELKKAIEEGYELINIEWSIIWDEGENPFKKIFNDIYDKRIKSENEFDRYFYKQILNGSIGKFGQTRTNQEILIDSIEKVNEYLQKSYQMIKGIEGKTDVMYVNKDLNKGEVKKYYAPIIPTLITANSRIIMYDNFKKIPLKDLCYTDTDSILMIGDYTDRFKIGKQIGEFKIEFDEITGERLINVDSIIWGTKAKSIGNNMALSGVFKSNLKIEDFTEGKVKSTKMLGIKNNRNNMIGKFIEEERDLNKQLKDFKKSEVLLASETIYIDNNIHDLTFFTEDLRGIEVTPIRNKTESIK